MPPNSRSWWTPPSTPRPPDDLIEAAAKDIPAALSDGEQRDDLQGQHYQEIQLLLLTLEQAGHSRNSISWALHDMVESGLISAVSFRQHEKDRVVISNLKTLRRHLEISCSRPEVECCWHR